MRDALQYLLLPFFRQMGLDGHLLDPTISEIMVTRRQVFVERDGASLPANSSAVTEERLQQCMQTVAHALNDHVDGYAKPWLDVRLPGGERLAAIFPPASPEGIAVSVRKFLRRFTTDELVKRGAMHIDACAAIAQAIHERKSILFSGGTSTGKTTMANAFVGWIQDHERLVVIEKPVEMQIFHENCLRLEAYPRLESPTNPRPEMTESQLLKMALRQRPDRIILGEVRDAEAAYALIQAMNTGHDGTFSTIHANTAVSALHRLASLARPGFGDIEIAREATAAAIRMVVEVRRDPRNGWRGVNRIIAVNGYTDHKFDVEELYSRSAELIVDRMLT